MLNYNLQMDLMLLRQIREFAGSIFVSGSEACEETRRDLLFSDLITFESLSKKVVKLLDHHGKGDAWKIRSEFSMKFHGTKFHQEVM